MLFKSKIRDNESYMVKQSSIAFTLDKNSIFVYKKQKLEVLFLHNKNKFKEERKKVLFYYGKRIQKLEITKLFLINIINFILTYFYSFLAA